MFKQDNEEGRGAAKLSFNFKYVKHRKGKLKARKI